jgi:hypothetical protein
MVNERFSMRTTVRQPRVVLMWFVGAFMAALVAIAALTRAHHGGFAPVFGQMWWWVVGPIFAAIQARPKIEVLDVDASAEGIRVGAKSVPRAKLKSALLRREADKTFVLLRGKGLGASVDVEVKSDEEADALCSALALDAKSTTAEFTLFRNVGQSRYALVGAAIVMAGIAFMTTSLHSHAARLAMLGATGLAFTGALVALILSRNTKILVGADGIVVREGFNKKRYLAHDEIEGVSAEGLDVVIDLRRGEEMRFGVGSRNAKKKQRAELELQAKSIVWRIEKARDAYRALAGHAPDGALALDRGARTPAEWLDQLRRIGQGATATFRSANLTRDQLLAIVESTTALAKERLAALVALHAGLTEEEKPRVRVAADRCALPALRERMVRVADASSDEELLAALDEAGAADAPKRASLT